MPWYRVDLSRSANIREIEYTSVEIEAADEEDARQRAGLLMRDDERRQLGQLARQTHFNLHIMKELGQQSFIVFR